MTKLKLLVELEYDEEIMYGDDKESRDWFFNDIIKEDQLSLFSREIGDIIGQVKVLSIAEE